MKSCKMKLEGLQKQFEEVSMSFVGDNPSPKYAAIHDVTSKNEMMVVDKRART